MPKEMEVTDKAEESVKELDELVSISLNEDGTVNLKLTKELFTEAIRDALDAGDDAESIPICILKYYNREQVEQQQSIEPEAEIPSVSSKAGVTTLPLCRNDVALTSCKPIVLNQSYFQSCAEYPTATPLDEMRWKCMGYGDINSRLIKVLVDQGIILRQQFTGKQAEKFLRKIRD